jgi:hypothetical protein
MAADGGPLAGRSRPGDAVPEPRCLERIKLAEYLVLLARPAEIPEREIGLRQCQARHAGPRVERNDGLEGGTASLGQPIRMSAMPSPIRASLICTARTAHLAPASRSRGTQQLLSSLSEACACAELRRSL